VFIGEILANMIQVSDVAPEPLVVKFSFNIKKQQNSPISIRRTKTISFFIDL
jgi:hypothetical protein